ncbi:MAG: hypothetical protein JWM84_3916 [Nocardioides sp.]|nr:hypothetical protein [Nocardioides sp.]
MAPRRPRLAVIVSNTISGDSRVQKTAIAAARDGWDVTLVGRATSERVERSRMGPIQVVRVPVAAELRRGERLRRRRTARSRLTQAGIPAARDHALFVASHESRARLRSERIARLAREDGVGPALQEKLVRVLGRLQREQFKIRDRAFRWEERRRPDSLEVVGDWRRDASPVLDLELAFGPVLEELRPDLIHANDVTMIHVAAIAAGRLRLRGHEVRWLYDAHEYVAGVEWPTEALRSAYPQLEAEFIGAADAVVTVSPEIASVLHRTHDLSSEPLVVRNSPVRETVVRSGTVSVREAAGVPEGTPLLVYSGYVDAGRGLEVAIDGLTGLDDVHLAVVANRHNPTVATLERQAARLGVHDRVHVVPYVDQHLVPDYLSTADLGILCLKRSPQYELALPTKVAEYLHAGLPVLTSDVATIKAFVEEHEVGAAYVGGDPASFAQVARQLLGDADRARANISQPLLEEHSWEHQVEGLTQLYRRLTGLDPEPRPTISWTVPEGPVTRQAALAGDAAEEEPPEDTTPWRPLGRTPIRLGLGIANYAGQLSSIAQAVTTARDDVSAEVLTRTTGAEFGYPADVYVRARSLTKLPGQIEQLQRILPRYTHLVADAFLPVFGSLNGSDIAADLPTLSHAGISVALLGHGSEVRHPVHHMDRLPFSHFFDAPDGVVDNLVRISERNREIAETSGLHVFVTTPDLLDDLPMATWIPLVVDVDAWACDRPVMERDRPVVLHAPSKRWTKGTDRFLPQLQALDDRGVIELRLVEGVPWATMRDMVQDADIVIDQVAIGSYGTFACEAMAAGKPVLANLTPTVTEVLREVPPIVNTPPDQVRETLERLLDDPSGTAAIGRRSVEYVRRLHDGRRSAEVLDQFLSR